MFAGDAAVEAVLSLFTLFECAIGFISEAVIRASIINFGR
jgi:hypothetical protein